jgi:LysM repeat protein
MNTPNPLVPQGSLQEQSKRKSQVRIIVFSILAIHVVLLGALLIQGCKREETPPPKIEPPAQPAPELSNNSIPPPAFVPTSAPPAFVPTSAPPAAVSGPGELPGAAATEHVIAKGETFGVLAKKYGVSTKALQQANPGVDSTKLKIGQKINIPPKPPGGSASPSASGAKAAEPEVGLGETLYTVKKGDTLTKVSKSSGVSVKAIRAANSLRTDQLKPGQKLKLPAKGAAAAAAAAAAVPAAAATTPAPTAPITSTTAPSATPAP